VVVKAPDGKYVRSLILVEKTSSSPSDSAPSAESLSSYISSLLPQNAQCFADLIRSHWGGCEPKRSGDRLGGTSSL
jgi:hypothetical protein